MATATVTNTVRWPDGTAAVGIPVIAELFPLDTLAFGPSGEVMPSQQTATDASGAWSLTLERTDTMTPTGMTYQITELDTRDGSQRIYYITVPVGGGAVQGLLTQAPGSVVPAGVVTVVRAGANVTVDSTNPQQPIVSASGGGGAGFAAPTIALGTAAAAGAAGTVIRSDATIAAFDATAPTTSAVADAAAVGSAAMAARRDHAHGREGFAVPGTSAIGDSPAGGAATTVSRSDHKHGREAAAAAGASAVGDSAATGTGPTVAYNDHRHAREGFATPGSSAVGDAAAAGSSTSLPRADHTHGRESFATNALALGTAAAPGISTHPFRADDTILAFDATAPATSAPSDAAAAGTAVVTARRDHKHGREGWGQVADVTNVAGGAAAIAGATGRVADAGHVHPLPDVLADVRAAAFGAFFDVVIVNDGGSDGSTANLNCSASSPFRASYDVGKTVLANVPGASGARGDTCGTTSGSATVTDASAVAGDVGKCVAGPGIPIGAWIISVVASTSFTLSSPATATAASVTLAVSLPLSTTISAVNSGSQAVLASGVATQGGALAGFNVQFGHDDTAAMQTAINVWGTNYAALKKTGWTSFATAVPTEILLPGGAAFINANALTMPAGLNFLDGELVIKGAGRDTTTLVCIGTTAFKAGSRTVSATLTQGSTTVTCAGILAADQGCGISGTNIPKGAQVGTVTPGVSFVMSLAAFASATITLTLQVRIPKLHLEDMSIFGNYLGAPNGCGGGRSSGAALLQALPPPFMSQVMPAYPGMAPGNAGTNNARNDTNCGTTNLSTTVTDAAIQSSDQGSVVTGTNIPANTSIVSVNPGVSFVMSNAATGTGTVTVAVQLYALSTATSATQLTDANANWPVNFWAGALVFIDEDKASNSTTAYAGCGYAIVASNDATHLNIGAWIPTRGGGTYSPSSGIVRYRIQGAACGVDLHMAERVRFIGPRGYNSTATVVGFRFMDCEVTYAGQAQDAGHNDSFGGSAGTYFLDNVLFDGGTGNYVDLSGLFPGLFPRLRAKGLQSRNRGAGGIFGAGVLSVINSNGLENTALSGVGYDGTTHEANRGNNVVAGNGFVNINVNGSGLSSARNDRVNGNIAADSPFGVMASPPAVPATGVALKNATVACDCTVIITAGAGSTTVVAINGVTVATILASGWGTFKVPSGASITLTYTSAPTWVWIGD